MVARPVARPCTATLCSLLSPEASQARQASPAWPVSPLALKLNEIVRRRIDGLGMLGGRLPRRREKEEEKKKAGAIRSERRGCASARR
jgi:hypothetical protein